MKGKKSNKPKIPKESKKLKYLYIIIVLFNGEKILKFGISNNYRRRFREYNDSSTVGFYLETLDIYKTEHPKRLETMIKWYMNQIDKPLFKYEYFDLKYYGLIKSELLNLSDYFNIPINKIV